MWNSRSVQLNVRLPQDLAVQAEEVQQVDPEFLSRVIVYGLTRRSIYRRLRETEELEAVRAALETESGFMHREVGGN